LIGLVSSVLRQQIGWEECLENNPFCVECTSNLKWISH